MKKMPDSQSDLSGYYTPEFYATRLDGSRKSAEIIVPLILARVKARSVVDVGCGTGAWLAVFSANGISDFHGFDGEYVDRSILDIPASAFTPTDLSLPLRASRRFELAVCLEVGEHLPETSAATLVQSLVGLADVVMFSAAPPGQGGMNHINEQWPEYWAALFERHGYRALDCIRPGVWNNPEVDWWYAQNTFVYASEHALKTNPGLGRMDTSLSNLSFHLVHPKSVDRLLAHLSAIREEYRTPGVLWCVRALAFSIKHAILSRLSKPAKNP